jgi:hypothetical protein
MPATLLLPQNFHNPHIAGDTECPLARAATAENVNKIRGNPNKMRSRIAAGFVQVPSIASTPA